VDRADRKSRRDGPTVPSSLRDLGAGTRHSQRVESRCGAVAASRSVSTSRSSNRTCGFPASGSRTRTHDFAHGKLRVRTLSRTSPRVWYRYSSENRVNPVLRILCLAHNHRRSRRLWIGHAPSPPRASRVACHFHWRTCRRHYPGGIQRPVVAAPCSRPGRGSRPSDGGLPRYSGGSAPTLPVSRPAQRSLTLRPACSLTPQGSLFLRCFSPIRYLLEPSQVLPAGATLCRAGFAPARINKPFTAHVESRCGAVV